MPASESHFALEFAKHISHGSLFLSSVEQIDRHSVLLPYAHYLQQAWAELNLAGALCVDGRPTVYLCEGKRFTTAQKRERQRFVWNQGLVPLLVLLTPGQVEVYSGVRKPLKPDAPDDTPDTALISDLGNIAETLECAKFIRSVETGQFFQDRRDFFPPGQAVDRCLVANLVQAARRLKNAGWKLDRAHSLLGRALFVSFLHQRGFIKPNHFPASTKSLLDIVKDRTVEDAKHLLYGENGLFSVLKREFNGTMFDAALATEARDIRKPHLDILADFLGGAEMESGQLTIFSDYDFRVIPVETISAIYEEFMKEEDLDRKYEEGAFYTPRHLAETTLHIAIENRYADAANWRVLDPACGSGIFLVGMFNMLAAQWLRDNANRSKKTKAQALLEILQQRIRGVDLNLDACRIASFSLYLALFEKLQPIDLDEFKQKVRADSFLPPLLWSTKEGLKAEPAVIIHGDFLHDELPLEKDYNLIIGNPPWESRGKEQIALHFAQRAPEFIRDGGIGCLILPTTILVNRHGTLNGEWFRTVTAEKVVQLADYRKLMFASAIHAGFIVRFQKAKPTLEHVVIYETPKVSRFDRRRGVIVVEPDDQKSVMQSDVLAANLQDKKQEQSRLQALWSRQFWGSSRDVAFLRRLDFLPRLSALVGTRGKAKRWLGGTGFQPFHEGREEDGYECVKMPWELSEPFLDAASQDIDLVVFPNQFTTIGDKLRVLEASTSKILFARTEQNFTPPMVLFSQGFTKIAFCSHRVFFQNAIRSITGPESDSDILRFLACFLGSRFVRYQSFHSGSSNGIGRDQFNLYESLNLGFPLPDDDLAPDDASKILHEAAEITKKVERDGVKAKPAKRAELVQNAMKQVEPLVEAYFLVSDTERILISDTLELWQPSIHKQNLDLDIPALRFPTLKDRRSYADTLANELNRFSRKQQIRISVEGMASEELNLIFITVVFGKEKHRYRETGGNAELWKALGRVNKAAQKENGPISYLRGFTYFERDRMHVLKPATLRNWSKSSALNDADAALEYLRGKPA